MRNLIRLVFQTVDLHAVGQDIAISEMPSFLDSESIKFLLEFAKLDIKRHELQNMLKELRLQARKNRIRSMHRRLRFMLVHHPIQTGNSAS